MGTTQIILLPGGNILNFKFDHMTKKEAPLLLIRTGNDGACPMWLVRDSNV